MSNRRVTSGAAFRYGAEASRLLATAISSPSHARRTALSSPAENRTAEDGDSIAAMYLVTKRLEFCYGHRLLDYDGVCKHPHGHNAVVEIDVRSGVLDGRNMVCDFSDIKR